jgi:23S rRNA (cytosine1962-C5)-methyltransferase
VVDTLTLRPGRERSLARRHPWILSGSVGQVDGGPTPGDTVLVRSSTGEPLAWAAYQPGSSLRARVWTFDTDEAVDAEFVARRLLDAADRRHTLSLGDPDGGARLVFSEADGLPGLTVDRYGDVAVVQLVTAGAERWRDVIIPTVAGLPGIATVYERSDTDGRRREGLEPRTGLVAGRPLPDELTFAEGSWRFLVDVERGHKTGFYLDQRSARAMLARLAPGRRVLNVFSYTGAFSVVAARAGAASVVSVDSSGPSLTLAQRQAELNGVDAGELVEADAFTELRRCRDRALQFDLIVLDPPKLAATAAQVDKASRAYKDLNLLALKLLAPGGILMTFSCSGAVDASLFRKIVAGAALDARREAVVVDQLHQPADHPVPLSFPEAEYLHGLVVWVQ